MFSNTTSVLKVTPELLTYLDNLNDKTDTMDTNILPTSEYTWHLIQIIFYILTYSIGTIGNLLVILVILLNRKLKTVTNMYLLHLAITDVIYLQSIPFSVITLIKQQWIFNFVFCKLLLVFLLFY